MPDNYRELPAVKALEQHLLELERDNQALEGCVEMLMQALTIAKKDILAHRKALGRRAKDVPLHCELADVVKAAVS